MCPKETCKSVKAVLLQNLVLLSLDYLREIPRTTEADGFENYFGGNPDALDSAIFFLTASTQSEKQ